MSGYSNSDDKHNTHRVKPLIHHVLNQHGVCVGGKPEEDIKGRVFVLQLGQVGGRTHTKDHNMKNDFCSVSLDLGVA